METIKREQLKSLLDRNESVYLINVLGSGEFERAHIPGSFNIPVADKDFIRKVEQRVGDRDAKVIVYCASFDCTASPKAAKKLDDSGFTHVVDFEGGVQDWREAGYPLEGAMAH
jgi:rhodanese-related sulfurtransferase